MKKIWFLIILLVGGSLLSGCNHSIIDNCWADCINESDIDILEHKCMEYVNKALFDNIERTPSPGKLYFYNNSWSMEYTFTDAEFLWLYYWIKWYAKAWNVSQKFICNIFTGWWLHDLYFYNDEPKENDYNQFLEDIKSSWEQPQWKKESSSENDEREQYLENLVPENMDINKEETEQTEENYEVYYDEKSDILVVWEKPMNVINLKIWNKTFDVSLEENSATKALIEKLQQWDVVVSAREYWWFEKVGNLGFDLPRSDKQITTEPGDLVLYQWNQISLFYESNSWSYTKLWKVHHLSESDLWDWDVTLVFSLPK